MSRTMFAMICLLALSLCSTARGHFVWVQVHASADGKPAFAAVWFNESPEAGAARLVDRIKSTQAWVRTSGGKTTVLELKPRLEGDTGGLVGAVASERPYAVEAACRYGVFAHGGDPILLHYYAKHLEAGDPSAWTAVARAEKLPLDIVPPRLPKVCRSWCFGRANPRPRHRSTCWAPTTVKRN